jgi:hypothetical protein
MLKQIDGVLDMATASSSASTYILALSLLFETLDDALKAFFAEGRSLLDSISATGLAADMLDDSIHIAGSLSAEGILEPKRPTAGRGSGVRRPQKLAPNEVTLAKGPMATEYSPRSDVSNVSIF